MIKLLVLFSFVNLRADFLGLIDPKASLLRTLEGNGINKGPVLVINGRLILLGYYDMYQYSAVLKFVKSISDDIFDFIEIKDGDAVEIDQANFEAGVLSDYQVHLRNFKELHFYFYGKTLYVIGDVYDEYSFDYLMNVAKMIVDQEKDIVGFHYCVAINDVWKCSI